MIDIVLTILTLALCASDFNQRDDGTTPAHIHVPLRKSSLGSPNSVNELAHLQRRDHVDAKVHYNFSHNSVYTFAPYLFSFELGTPPQSLELVLDSSNGDTVVFGPNGVNRRDFSLPSLFDSSKSSTFHESHTNVSLNLDAFGDTWSSGNYSQDTLTLGNVSIENFPFATADHPGTYQGIAGFGIHTRESREYLNATQQPFLLQLLKNQGAIQKAVYSLWLNPEGDGSILFGAIDLSKNGSDFYRMPLVPTNPCSDEITDVAVRLNGLSAYDNKNNEQTFATCALAARLNTGLPYSYMPTDLITPFMRAIGATTTAEDFFTIECDRLNSDKGGIGIQIGGIEVRVGFSDLFVELPPIPGKKKSRCIPGFRLTRSNTVILGTNILQTLYVSYDFEDLELGIAAVETNKESRTHSSIIDISSSIPGIQVDLGSELRDVYEVSPVTLFTSIPREYKESSTANSATSTISVSATCTPPGTPLNSNDSTTARTSISLPNSSPQRNETYIIGPKYSRNVASKTCNVELLVILLALVLYVL